MILLIELKELYFQKSSGFEIENYFTTFGKKLTYLYQVTKKIMYQVRRKLTLEKRILHTSHTCQAEYEIF